MFKAETETLTVDLPSDLAARVREAVKSGEYPTNDAAVKDALYGWSQRSDFTSEQVSSMREAIREAVEDPRPYMPMDEVFDRLEAKYKVLAEEQTK